MQGAWVLLLLGLRLQLSLGVIPAEEEDPTFWNRQAAQALDTAKKLQPIQTAAKNLILFLGDGECAGPVHAPEPPQSWYPGPPMHTAGPGDSDLTKFCSFRDGGVHGERSSDPKGADPWQAGT